MTRLSVNINKIATLRNARGGDNPNVMEAAKCCQFFGAEGITVHPRPDERHIRYQDVRDLKPLITTELNIEGNPNERFQELVLEVCPTQVTLVPDSESQITSNHGWDTITNQDLLAPIISRFHAQGIRTSVFVDASVNMVRGAKEAGADRIELYTEPYAANYSQDRQRAIAPFILAAEEARRLGLGVNAGHDLSLQNLRYFVSQIDFVDEVSIGHALISDALYMGLNAAIKAYLGCLG